MATGKAYYFKEFYPDLEKGLKNVITLYDKLEQKTKELQNTASTGKGLKQINTIQKETNALIKERIRFQKQLDPIEQKRLATQRQAAKAVRDQANAEVQFQRAAKGSLNAMRAQLKILKLRHANLEIGSKKEIAYRNKILQTTNALKKNEAAIGINKINIGNYGSALSKVSGQIMNFVKGFGLMTAAMMIGRVFKNSIKLFQVQEQAVRDSNIIFGEYSEVIQRAATETQKLTTVGDEAYLRLANQAKNFGIETYNVNNAVQGSIGLAEKFKAAGLSQETALKGVANAYEGNFSQLERYIPALRTAKTESEKMAILQKEMASGFDLAKEAAKTSAGRLIQLKNKFGDLQEKIGSGFAPVLINIIDKLSVFIDRIESTSEDLSDIASVFGDFSSEGEETNETLDKLNDGMSNLIFPIKGLLNYTRKLIGGFKELLVQLKLIELETDQYAKGLDRTKMSEEELEEQRKIIEENKKKRHITNTNRNNQEKKQIEDLTKAYNDFYAGLSGKDEKGLQDFQEVTDLSAQMANNIAKAEEVFESAAGQEELSFIQRVFGTEADAQSVQQQWSSLYGTLSQIVGNFYDTSDNLREKDLQKDKRRRNIQKGLDITNATINTYLAATDVLATTKGGFLAKALAMVLTIGLGLSQVAKIASAKYAKGTEYLQLNGNPKGTDTIPILANEGERILTTEQNSKIPKSFPNAHIPMAVNYYMSNVGKGQGNTDRLLSDINNKLGNQTVFVSHNGWLIGYKGGQLTGERIKIA